MRLVLHIGMAKTGTSTLQRELAVQRRELAKQGICYPVVGGASDHSALNCLIRDFDRVPRYFHTPARGTEESMRRFGERFWDRARRELHDSDADVAVLSSEYLFYLRDNEVERLLHLLRSVFSDISVVAYVRAPVSYYVAVTQQRIKAAHDIVPPGQYRVPIRRCLERYRSAFDGSIAVRAYDRSRLVDEDIVSDFCDLALPEGTSLRQRAVGADLNTSMSAEAMCIVQRFRRHRFSEENDVFNVDTERLIHALRRLEGSPRSAPELRPEVAAVVAESHRADLEWLADEFGVVFPTPDPGAGRGADDPGGGSVSTSTDVSRLLRVEAEGVEEVLYALVHDLVQGSRRDRMSRAARRRVARALRRVRR